MTPEDDPVARVQKAINRQGPSPLPHSQAYSAIQDYKAWLESKGIPVSKLLKYEAIVVPAHVSDEMMEAGARAVDDYFSGSKDASFEGSTKAVFEAMAEQGRSELRAGGKVG